MSAWPEALYIVKQLKTAIQDLSYRVITKAADLDNIQGAMRFSTKVLSDTVDTTPTEEVPSV